MVAALRSCDRFDLLVVSDALPSAIEVATLERVAAVADGAPIALLRTAPEQGAHLAPAQKAYLSGAVSTEMGADAFAAAIRLLAAGESFWRSPAGGSARREAHPLSTVEEAVLEQLFRGASNKEIADALRLTEASIKMHVRRLSEKIDAKNRTEIILKALIGDLAPRWFSERCCGCDGRRA